MKKVNTFISDNYIRKAVVYVDKNNHYHLELYWFEVYVGWERKQYGRSKFKHIESVQRAVNKWIK